MVAIAGAAAAALGAGSSILGGMGAQQEATKARRAQETAAQKQLDWTRHMWSAEQVQREPWVTEGRDALRNLRSQAESARDNPQYWQARPGLNADQYRWQAPPPVNLDQHQFNPMPVTEATQYAFRGPQAVDAGQYRFDPSGYRYTPTPTLDPNQYGYTPTESGTLGRFDFKPPTVTDDPGYQFRLQQGVGALDASAAARGGLGSGAQQRALARYGQDLGSQEYGAAYGRAWQQQQEQYERQRLMNMTQEERQRYGNQVGYERGLAANLTTEERQRYGNMTDYERANAANQWNFGSAMQGQQAAWQQGRAENELSYNRAVQQQENFFRQGLAMNDLGYQREAQQNQQLYDRGLTANQMDWQRAVYGNEQEQQRAWQEYAATMAERDRNWNQWSTLAGLGTQQMNQLGPLGATYTQGMNNALNAQGQATAAGAINQSNARNSMYSGIAGSVNQGLQNWMMAQYMQGLQQPTASPTSGTLPTTWQQYTQGNYPATTYAPFG